MLINWLLKGMVPNESLLADITKWNDLEMEFSLERLLEEEKEAK